MEENKKTSKEILPESEREQIRTRFIKESLPYLALLSTEAAEMEVEEKDRLSNHWRGMFISAKSLTEDQKTEISSLKREIEEMKSKLDISGYKGNIKENLC